MSLPPAKLIADFVKLSPYAHMFHFYSLLCKITSVPGKAPSARISADRLAALVFSGMPTKKEKEMKTAATGRTHHPSTVVLDRTQATWRRLVRGNWQRNV